MAQGTVSSVFLSTVEPLLSEPLGGVTIRSDNRGSIVLYLFSPNFHKYSQSFHQNNKPSQGEEKKTREDTF